MKKWVLIALIALLAGAMAFADHPDVVGLGGVVGGGLALPMGYDPAGLFYPGLSLKVPQLPIFWGFYASVHAFSTGFGATADYYFIDKNFVSETATNEDGSYNVKIDWYLGAGLFSNVHFWFDGDGDGGAAVDIGVRVPVGVSWHIIKQLELFLAAGPAVGVYTGTGIQPHFYPYGFGELGIRYWWVD